MLQEAQEKRKIALLPKKTKPKPTVKSWHSFLTALSELWGLTSGAMPSQGSLSHPCRLGGSSHSRSEGELVPRPRRLVGSSCPRPFPVREGWVLCPSAKIQGVFGKMRGTFGGPAEGLWHWRRHAAMHGHLRCGGHDTPPRPTAGASLTLPLTPQLLRF